MLASLYSKLEKIKRTELSAENEEKIRGDIADLLSAVYRRGALADSLRQSEKLRELERECLIILNDLQNTVLLQKTSEDLFPRCLHFSGFLINLISACDLCLCTRLNRIVYNGQESVFFPFDSEILQIAFYNIIALTVGKLTHADVLSVDMTADADTVRVTFTLPCSKSGNIPLIFDLSEDKLKAAVHAVKLHGGVILVRNTEKYCRLLVTVSRHHVGGLKYPTNEPRSFIDLMCDRLSPLYIGLSGVCGNPV